MIDYLLYQPIYIIQSLQKTYYLHKITKTLIKLKLLFKNLIIHKVSIIKLCDVKLE